MGHLSSAVDQDSSLKASVTLEKSPEGSALDPTNTKLIHTLPGTYTEQESRTRL